MNSDKEAMLAALPVNGQWEIPKLGIRERVFPKVGKDFLLFGMKCLILISFNFQIMKMNNKIYRGSPFIFICTL